MKRRMFLALPLAVLPVPPNTSAMSFYRVPMTLIEDAGVMMSFFERDHVYDFVTVRCDDLILMLRNIAKAKWVNPDLLTMITRTT